MLAKEREWSPEVYYADNGKPSVVRAMWKGQWHSAVLLAKNPGNNTYNVRFRDGKYGTVHRIHPLKQ